MARYGVRVIGTGRSWYVLADLPGNEQYRRGPMSEPAAMAVAKDLSDELQAMAAGQARQSTAVPVAPVVDENRRRSPAPLYYAACALLAVVYVVLNLMHYWW